MNSSEIEQIYDNLAEDVLTREERIQEELPVDTTAEIHTHINSVAEDWKSGRKSLRTVPVCSVYARELGSPPKESIRNFLTGLDASVNILDDIIDTHELSPQVRIGLTVNAAFSAVLLAENCPPNARDEIREQLRDYFTALFQIPLVEQQLFDSMTAAESRHQRNQAAGQIYAYRSRDIEGFADVAAIEADIGTEAKQRLRSDLRTYRARRLLFKDIRDVERDLQDKDVTPIIHFLKYYQTADDVLDSVTELYSRFSYSEVGDERYGETLRKAEKEPEDLHSLLSEAMGHVATDD